MDGLEGMPVFAIWGWLDEFDIEGYGVVGFSRRRLGSFWSYRLSLVVPLGVDLEQNSFVV